MTKNQIEYGKLLESRRAAMASEALTRARDTETARHNVASERVSLDTLAEQRRSHLAQEALSAQQLAELTTHNRATESISLGQLGETKRTNLAKEGETKRSNLAKEGEARRHNIAAEFETARHNVATESVSLDDLAERQRHNVATEGLTQTSQSIERNKAIVSGVTGLLNVGVTTRGQDVSAKTIRRGQDIQQEYNEGKLDVERSNATSQRISAVAKAVEAGTKLLPSVGRAFALLTP